ncbi:PAAR domain-containing protein [Vibrio splendidus]|jgi:uncharacterized Zn-binding protein involved in type VI secretion|uniref:PAAR domain-containing protein n=1 Tax=Vibrio TaxID=662 RepID=UPI000C84AAEA|nr:MULTISPECIES: PAAR domain-containing protein [Vibrio]PMH68765.1 hypothetical protein BCU61_16890 [Vibrio splendidus]PMJ31763.1 hypothetical protein BCU26_02210 [Vibrio splendidus]PMN22114.1 hypothetical protein BCT37_12440 [Vibrio cyclitrophicus]
MAGLATEANTIIGPGPWLPTKAIASSQTVTIGDSPVLLHDDDVVERRKPGKNPSWKSSKVVVNSSKVIIEGKRAASIGDVTADGGVIVGIGQTNVFGS